MTKVKKSIYLDYAAATPMDEVAVAAMRPYFKEQFYNPSAAYQAARNIRHDVETARAKVADVLGAKDQEVIFTAGGTEANNLAIYGVMSQFPEGNVVVSAIEHESVLEPASQYNTKIVPVSKYGHVNLRALEHAIDDTTVLVSIMYANNEVGTIQPISEIAKVIKQKRSERRSKLPLYLHTDACQAANYLDLQISRLGVDLMTLNGGKIYGPKQSGCLYLRSGVQLGALIHGGGQESSMRSGTENVAAITSFATMLQKVQSERKGESYRLQQISNELIAKLSQKISHIELNGDHKKRLPNNVNILVPGVEGERLLMELDEAGIMVATGSACTASNDTPSHVLLALGLSQAQASASLRITLGRQSIVEEVEHIAETISTVVARHARS